MTYHLFEHKFGLKLVALHLRLVKRECPYISEGKDGAVAIVEVAL